MEFLENCAHHKTKTQVGNEIQSVVQFQSICFTPISTLCVWKMGLTSTDSMDQC